MSTVSVNKDLVHKNMHKEQRVLNFNVLKMMLIFYGIGLVSPKIDFPFF